MAQNKAVRFGPVAMANSATNIINTAITSLTGPVGYTQTQPYALITHIRIVNKTAGSVNASLFIGATGASAAGTEFAFSATPVGANSYVDWFGRLRLDSGDFLVGLASAASSLTFEAEGEAGLA